MPETASLPATVLGAAQQTAALGVSGYGGVAFQVQGGFSATLTFEATVHGAEWVPFNVSEPDSSTRVTTTTAAGVFVGSAVGFTSVRARVSAYTSGAASVIIRAVGASPGGGGSGGGAGTDVNLVEVGGSSIALGQAAMAASLPVVIASDQTPIPITGSITADNNAAGPVGDPIPTDASSTAYEGPTGNLETFKLESFDYDTSGSTQLQTTIGLVTPSSTGSLPVPGGSGTSAGAMRVELPTNGTGVIATVGAVTTVSTVTAVTAITNALPAGTNLLGRVSSSSETNTVYDGTTALTPKFAAIAAASSGNNTLVAAVTSKKIRVLAYNFIANGTVNAKFQSGAGGTDLTGLKYCIANMGLCANYNPVGWFESASGVLLNLNLSGAVAVGGELVYVEV